MCIQYSKHRNTLEIMLYSTFSRDWSSLWLDTWTCWPPARGTGWGPRWAGLRPKPRPLSPIWLTTRFFDTTFLSKFATVARVALYGTRDLRKAEWRTVCKHGVKRELIWLLAICPYPCWRRSGSRRQAWRVTSDWPATPSAGPRAARAIGHRVGSLRYMPAPEAGLALSRRCTARADACADRSIDFAF